MTPLTITQEQRRVFANWFPGIVAGFIAGLAFMTLGHTSVIRASGLALIIAGMTMLLRRSGATLAIIGGLALAFSPAFWSQTGGADSLNLAATLAVLALAGLIGFLLTRVSDAPYLGLAAGLILFAVLFWSQLATPRSLRLTTLLAVGTLYLLVDVLHITNPRPDESQAAVPGLRHQVGLLLFFGIGVVNDPLFTLLAPAILIGMLLSRMPLPWWYWALMAGLIGIGLYGIVIEYVSSTWWSYPAAEAELVNLQVPYVMADGWREASRWISLFELVIGQFTVFGILLGMVGLARLARWYPPLGTVTMIAYATYAVFGLVYFGRNSAVLLLPLLMIQVLWMTYAVYSLGEWLKKSFNATNQLVRWLAPAAYVLLALLLLARIADAR